MQPDGNYYYVQAEVTLYSVPITFAAVLEQGRVLLVPRPYEAGLSNNTCRIIQLSRDVKADNMTVYCVRSG
jgi:hypothetical protein